MVQVSLVFCTQLFLDLIPLPFCRSASLWCNSPVKYHTTVTGLWVFKYPQRGANPLTSWKCSFTCFGSREKVPFLIRLKGFYQELWHWMREPSWSFFLLQPRAVIANVSSFNVQHRQNHAILTSSSDIRTMCGFPVSFLESHLIESRLARANVWESFRRDPFHVSSLRLSWTSWAQTFLTCGLWTQICLPIEYPYRILSIFPTDSRRNQAGTSIVSTLDTAYEDMTPR